MKTAQYLTWYEFKKDLQKEARHSVLNQEWLQVKPQKPLPWDRSSMKSTLVKLSAATRN
jgi:hypothetical protein